MKIRVLSLPALVVAVAFGSATPAFAADPDPDEFTPVGYEFCGWRDFTEGGWKMEWDESLSGAYLVAFARNMTCKSARRNVLRVRYTQEPPYRPTRPGYRCKTLESDYEYADVRCAKRGKPSVAFRWQTGA